MLLVETAMDAESVAGIGDREDLLRFIVTNVQFKAIVVGVQKREAQRDPSLVCFLN